MYTDKGRRVIAVADCMQFGSESRFFSEGGPKRGGGTYYS